MNQTESINITSTHTPTTNAEAIVAGPALGMSTSDIISLVIGIITIAIAVIAIVVQVWYNRKIKDIVNSAESSQLRALLDQRYPSPAPVLTPPPSAYAPGRPSSPTTLSPTTPCSQHMRHIPIMVQVTGHHEERA